jgi:WD40 repeat protein/transcriptional regulator with XRE-family HTH domain
MKVALTFGGWLKRRRGSLGLTQKELAQQVGYAEITLRKVEADELRPSRQMAEKLAEVLQLPSEARAQFIQFARDEPGWEDFNLPTQGLAVHLPLSATNFSSQSVPLLSYEQAQPERANDLYNPLHTPDNPKVGNHLPGVQPNLDLAKADWREAPAVGHFHGRQVELAQLHQWLVNDHCTLVALLGMGGVGKTALTAMLATQVENQFDAVIWRSLRNAPPLAELLGECLRVVSNHQEHELPPGVDKRLPLLMAYLRQRRCLIVLDNFETVLRSERTGSYLPGYEGYGQLLQWVGEGRHQSCLVLTSREKPKELTMLEGEIAAVHTLPLTGLQPVDSRSLLQDRGLSGSEDQWAILHARYSGNPLALKVVAETVLDLFAGNIVEFLQAEIILFSDISDLLAQQLARLSPLEQELLFWLAVEREPVGLEELRTDLVQLAPKLAVLEALRSLHQHSLVERTVTGFTVQNVVMEYLTVSLIDQVCDEIATGQMVFLYRHALLKAQAKSYVRESQRTLILAPIVRQLVDRLGRTGAVERLSSLLAVLRDTQPLQTGYSAGNLLNLMVQLKGDLRGLNFSQLAVWQADLRAVEAQDTNFRQANFAGSVFTDAFAAVVAVAFSPDGERLAASNLTNEVRIWRVKDGQPLLTCMGHTDRVNTVSFSPNGALVASGSWDRTVRLWNLQRGRCISILEGHTYDVETVSFSPNGAILASGSWDHTVRLWEVHSGRCLATLQGHTDIVYSVSFCPDGTLLASGSRDQTVRLWDVHSGQCLAMLQGHTNGIFSVSFSPDGHTLASGSADKTVRLWDIQSGQCLATLEGHTYLVHSVSFSPDGALVASGSYDQMVRLWDIHRRQCRTTLQGHTNKVRAVSFSPDGQTLVSGGWDGTMRLWDVHSGRCFATLRGYINEIGSICFSPNGRILASSNSNQTIRLWDMQSRRCFRTLSGHINWVNAISFSPDGHTLASGSEDQTVRLWDVLSGQCVAILEGHTHWINAISFSPDGHTVASGSYDQTVRLWNTDSGQCIAILEGHTGDVSAVSFSPDGTILASGSYDHTVRLWDTHSLQCLTTLQGHEYPILCLSFSPDGHLLATGGGDRMVRLWAVQSRQCLAILQGNMEAVLSVRFSPDGHILASSSTDDTIRLWDVESRQCFALIPGHSYTQLPIDFSPDGHLLASGSADDTIRLWNLQTRECVGILCGDKPYERMNITGVTGLSHAQIAVLKALGAVEDSD